MRCTARASAMKDSALIERFLEMMAAERGASRNTLSAYRRDLEQAARLAGGRLAKADTAALRRIMADYRSLAASSARSEEHTSELQSLMRISYAVFCLKNTKSHIKKQY